MKKIAMLMAILFATSVFATGCRIGARFENPKMKFISEKSDEKLFEKSTRVRNYLLTQATTINYRHVEIEQADPVSIKALNKLFESDRINFTVLEDYYPGIVKQVEMGVSQEDIEYEKPKVSYTVKGNNDVLLDCPLPGSKEDFQSNVLDSCWKEAKLEKKHDNTDESLLEILERRCGDDVLFEKDGSFYTARYEASYVVRRESDKAIFSEPESPEFKKAEATCNSALDKIDAVVERLKEKEDAAFEVRFKESKKRAAKARAETRAKRKAVERDFLASF